ncbi:MAG TPA: hypothetical protein PKZ20_10150 [Rhodocyclaceae bacterium]|nr:hypothetical protein [Rhodocyclaceae bacterium]
MAIDFSNMGVALGAGVDEWHRQQAEARAQQRAEQEQEQFGWQRQQYEQQRQQYEQQQAIRAKKQAALDAFNAHQEYAAELDNTPDDKLGDYVQRGITQYNTNPYFKNGFFAKLTTVNGQPVVVHEDGVTRKAEHLPLSRDMIRQGLGVMDGMLRRHLTSMTPEDYLAESDRQDARGLKIRELAVHERNAATNEAYRKDQIDARREEIERRKNEVTYQQDGTGQIYALRDGKVVGVIGRPRPIQGGGGGGVDYSLSPAEQSKFADVLARYNAEQDPAKQAAIAREYQMLQSNALLMRGKVPNLPAAMLKGSTSTVSPELMAKYLTAREALDAMKPKPKIPFYSDTPKNAAEIAAWEDKSARLDAGFAALGLPQEMFSGGGRGGISDFAVPPPVARPKAPPVSVQPAAPFSGGGDPRLTGYGLPYTRTTPIK